METFFNFLFNLFIILVIAIDICFLILLFIFVKDVIFGLLDLILDLLDSLIEKIKRRREISKFMKKAKRSSSVADREAYKALKNSGY